MKIAMIGQKRVPSREGGVEVVVEELAGRMSSLGHRVDCLDRKGPLAESPAGAFACSAVNTLKALLGGYDVIHFHAEGPAAMSFLVKMAGIPCVATIHGLDWQRAKWKGFAVKYLRFGEKTAARCCDELIVLSSCCAAYFKNTYGRSGRLVRNGADTRIAGAAAPPARLGLEAGGYVLFASRIVPEKGLHYLLEAFAGLETDKRLVVAGRLAGGKYSASIKAMAAADPRVVMAGFVGKEELGALFAGCSVYVLPSDIEGMSVSLLEALASGARCLVSDIPENRETAGEFAEYFEPASPLMLREKLGAMLSRPDLPQRKKLQAEAVCRRFSWDAAAEQTLAIYEEVIGRRAKKAAKKSRKNKRP